MSWYYHMRSSSGDTCLYDCEDWPCTTASAILDFVRDLEDSSIIMLAEQAFKVADDQ